MTSVLVSLYAVTKVLSQIWGPPFCPGPLSRGYGGPFLRLCVLRDAYRRTAPMKLKWNRTMFKTVIFPRSLTQLT